MATSNFILEMVGAWLHPGANFGVSTVIKPPLFKQFHRQGSLRWQHQSFSIDLILWLIPVGFLIQIIQKLIRQKKEAVRDSIGDLLIMGLVIYAHFF